MLHGAADRLNLHHHTRTAAKRGVVARPVYIGRKVPDVDDIEIEKAFVLRLLYEAFIEGGFKHGLGNNVRTVKIIQQALPL